MSDAAHRQHAERRVVRGEGFDVALAEQPVAVTVRAGADGIGDAQRRGGERHDDFLSVLDGGAAGPDAESAAEQEDARGGREGDRHPAAGDGDVVRRRRSGETGIEDDVVRDRGRRNTGSQHARHQQHSVSHRRHSSRRSPDDGFARDRARRGRPSQSFEPWRSRRSAGRDPMTGCDIATSRAALRIAAYHGTPPSSRSHPASGAPGVPGGVPTADPRSARLSVARHCVGVRPDQRRNACAKALASP